MSIEEKIVRRNQEDLIEIGQVLNKFYNGQAGVVVRAIIQGLITTEAKGHWHNQAIVGDRILGRIEGISMVREEIELAIQTMQQLTEPIEEENNDG